ncbi:hypothetical protein BGAL_0231g00130 [Botrytis galanthina]|uniref:Uncharacterized protein n=1 Tax=Botrytis galanthina TaxID=278940 RepID=A0A4S8QUY6_9HELO|nr:hypothetical protein BGAL_0231g00130 [Botrytis galanthina]
MPVASMALTPYSNYLAPEQMEVEENEKKCDESNKSTRPIRQNFDIATGSRMMSSISSRGHPLKIFANQSKGHLFPHFVHLSHTIPDIPIQTLHFEASISVDRDILPLAQSIYTYLSRFCSSIPSCTKTPSLAKMLQTLVIVLICIVAVIVLIGLAALINTGTKKTGPNIPV